MQKMDLLEVMNLAGDRLQSVEPDPANNLVDYSLASEHACDSIYRLALCSSKLDVLSLVDEPKRLCSPLSHSTFPPSLSTLSFKQPHRPYGLCLPTNIPMLPLPAPKISLESVRNEKNLQKEKLYDIPWSIPQSRRRFCDVQGITPKFCYYYSKGYCKFGEKCRNYHPPLTSDSQVRGVDGALKTLELELVDLLRSRRGRPVSIATLPALYQRRFRKVLQIEGYLPESQRQERTGYNLTSVLSRLNNTLRIRQRCISWSAIKFTHFS